MTHQDDMDDMFDTLTDIGEQQRTFIKHRYRFLMNEYRFRARLYSILFYIMRSTITVGSLAVPALLSLQSHDSSDLYWFTWGLSLAVTTANGITTLFKLESKFLNLHTTMENIRTETWQYLELSGRYSGHHGSNHAAPTHKNQYVFYCSKIEKLRMKQVGDEYVRHSDAEQNHTPQGQGQGQGHGHPLIGIGVPSPADQALTKPRRDSEHTLGDDSVIELVAKKQTVPVSIRSGTMSESGEVKVFVLPESPKM
jgi:hypothetical protein